MLLFSKVKKDNCWSEQKSTVSTVPFFVGPVYIEDKEEKENCITKMVIMCSLFVCLISIPCRATMFDNHRNSMNFKLCKQYQRHDIRVANEVLRPFSGLFMLRMKVYWSDWHKSEANLVMNLIRRREGWYSCRASSWTKKLPRWPRR